MPTINELHDELYHGGERLLAIHPDLVAIFQAGHIAMREKSSPGHPHLRLIAAAAIVSSNLAAMLKVMNEMGLTTVPPGTTQFFEQTLSSMEASVNALRTALGHEQPTEVRH